MGSLLGGLKHLAYAILLIAALLCASEVGLRALRCHRELSRAEAGGDARQESLIVPSDETYLRLRPLAAVERPDLIGSETVFIRTNSCGLRGPEIAVPKPQGVFRIICLGDDATLALDLPEDATYCARLEQRLQQHTDLRVEAINAGLPGGCPLTSYLLLRHRLIGLQPDLVLLHFDASDLNDDGAIRPVLYVDEQGTPVAAVHPLCAPHPLPVVDRLSGEFALVDWARGRLGRVWAAAGEDADVEGSEPGAAQRPLPASLLIEQAIAPVDDIRRLAASVFCELVVTTPFDPLAGQSISEDPSQSAAGLEALLVARGARFLDAGLAPAGSGGGLSAEEHALYAQAQADYIVAQIPGVWTKVAPPTDLRPLPGVARTPRGATE